MQAVKKLFQKLLKSKQHDFELEGNTKDNDDYKFVWGVKSHDDLHKAPAGLDTMNDIEIVYSKKKNRYILDIETAYWFDTQDGVIEYLHSLLTLFTKYMDEQGYDRATPYRFWMSQPSALFEEETISELYTSFKIFVEGFISVHTENEKVQRI